MTKSGKPELVTFEKKSTYYIIENEPIIDKIPWWDFLKPEHKDDKEHKILLNMLNEWINVMDESF